MIDIKKIRADFPILNRSIYEKPLVYLDNAATTQKPSIVINKTAHFYKNTNSNIHRGVHYLSNLASDAFEDARRTVMNFINASSPAEIIFTNGTTSAINMVAECFGEAFIDKDDEVIITEMEHHSNIVPWQVLCKNKGAVLRVLPFNNDGKLMLEDLPKLINRRTKIITLCHVSNVLGVINPVKEVIELAHRFNIPVLLDAAQSTPHFTVDVQELDCDFLTFSGHKMYAETGIGVLYGKEEYLEKMPPYQTGGGMVKHVDFSKTIYSDLPFKFEAGTPNYAGAVSLAAAIDYIKNIGHEKISIYEDNLLQYAGNKLSSQEGLSIYGNQRHHCGSISFNLKGIHHYDAGLLLDKMGIAIRTGTLCAQPVMNHFGVTGAIRAAFALYNTTEEVDILLEGIRKVRKILS